MRLSKANEPHDIHTLPHSLLFLLPFDLSPSLPFILSVGAAERRSRRTLRTGSVKDLWG